MSWLYCIELFKYKNIPVSESKQVTISIWTVVTANSLFGKIWQHNYNNFTCKKVHWFKTSGKNEIQGDLF